MISLTCTSCQKVLQIDDAFAGGVCRCQYCGTIQTVPSSLKKNPGTASPASKALYQRKSRASRGQSAPPPPETAAAGAPPDEPKRETKLRAAAPVANPPPRDLRALRPVLIIAGVAVVLIIGIIVWVSSRS